MSNAPESGAPNEFLKHLMHGADLLRANQLDEARGAILSALALQPGEARARNLLGLVHFRLGELAESRNIYRGLANDYPTDNGYRLNLGLVHLRIGEIDDAIAELDRVVNAEPDNQRALGYLGLAYAQVGDAARARDAFVKAGQPDLAKEMEARLAGVPPAGDAGAPGDPAEFTQERTAVAPDDVIQRAVQASAEPDEDDVDAAFDELERGFAEIEAGRAAPAPAGPPPYEEAVIGATPPADQASGAAAEKTPAATGDGPPPAAPAAAPADGAPVVAAAAAASVAAEAAAPRPRPGAFDVRLLADVCRQGEKEAEADGLMARDGEAEVPVVVEGEETRDVAAAEPVSAFVTRGLLHPDEPGAGFTVGAGGGLLCRISGSVAMRLTGGAAVSGSLDFAPAQRRVRGRLVEEPLGGADPFYNVHGEGSVLALAGGARFVPLLLHDDIIYVREEAVFAFGGDLHWESGRIPGLGAGHPMLQFRGRGGLALRVRGSLSHIKLERGQTLGVDAAALFGWVGRLVPHAMVGGAGRAIGCTGEGVLLLCDPDGQAAPG
jgi:uncharacterized protein (AIM24 family)/thioredoxin-like negative regulator of GroEL